MNFRGATEDSVNPRIAVITLNRQRFAESHATEDLHRPAIRVGGNPLKRLPGGAEHDHRDAGRRWSQNVKTASDIGKRLAFGGNRRQAGLHIPDDVMVGAARA